MNWLYRLPRRDQIALLLLLISILVYFLWIGVVATLQRQSEQQQQRTMASEQALVRVQGMVSEIGELEAQGVPERGVTSNLPQLVDRSLRENQLSMSGFQPGRDGDVRLRLESANFEQLMQWLYELEFRHGVKVGELSLLPTRQAGHVSVQVQLIGKGR